MKGLENFNAKSYKLGFIRGVFAIGIILILLFGVFSFGYSSNLFGLRSTSDFVIPDGEGIEVDIPKGSSTLGIGRVLAEKSIINYPQIFRLLSRINGFDGMYKSGVHVLDSKMSYDQIMKVLTKNPKHYEVTIAEGLNLRQIEDLLLKKNLVNKEKIEKLFNDGKFEYDFIKNIPARKNRLEGYVFPDTYFLNVGEDEETIVKKMLSNFSLKYKQDYKSREKELGMSMDKIITLASIVEREAKVDSERRKIAGVFYNRLKMKGTGGMRLQSCATVEYILFMKTGSFKEKLSDLDTKIEDPYNTYIYSGLPPGPICSPGIASIEAALYPEKNDYLYFVTIGDGTHAFSKTIAEHNAAVRRYGGK